ncbi:MAG: PP2C family serine/threonine-protein phosphatase [Bacteroidota bacterium]
MDDKQLATVLFESQDIKVPASRKVLFEKFIQENQNKSALTEIFQKLQDLMAKWQLENRIADIMQQPVRLLNATIGKPYESLFDFKKLNFDDIASYEFVGLDEAGLYYDERTKQITGVPKISGDIKIIFRFKVKGQDDNAPMTEKIINLVINPDPRSLWKNIESDPNDPYWKEDNVTVFAPLGDRHILVSSKRGRSHANVGSFREDDFAFKDLPNGWSIVVVSDGAGSAKISRKGSALACNGIVDYFMTDEAVENMIEFDNLVQQHKNNTGDDTQKKLNRFVYNNLGKAAFSVHKQLENFAKEAGVSIKELGNTLIYTLFKKYDIGYAFLSFGVGDCPIAILNKDITEVTLMNWLDVGEFGGGTRFITMPEIFQNEKFSTRFGFKLTDDFSYLMLMTDGIYDPKFVVESNLQNIKYWHTLLADLNGANEDGVIVELNPGNKQITEQFSAWMDFWSKGNHDDRTLAIVF